MLIPGNIDRYICCKSYEKLRKEYNLQLHYFHNTILSYDIVDEVPVSHLGLAR